MKRSNNKELLILLVFPLLLLFPMVCVAQVTTATIEGTVLDQSGLGIPGATVSVLNQGTVLRKTAISGELGQFTFTFLPPGTYTVSIEMAGFKTYQETDLPLVAGQKLRRDFTLELGEVTDSITVASQATLVNAASAEQDVNMTEMEVRELPLLRRDIRNILNLGTGITAETDVGVSMNGLPPRGFLFTIDGINAAGDAELRSLGMYQDFNIIKGVSLEAVEQVQIAKNIFSAEIANAVGGNVNLITKKGTNDFHGSAFWNYQAGGLNARYQFASTPESLVFHQFGGSIGGPIKKDSMFFFGAFEGYRLTAQRTVVANFPTQEYRNLILATNPEMGPGLDLLPLPTDPISPGDYVGFYRGREAQSEEDNHAIVRWDWNVTSGDLLTARYKRSRPETSDPRAIPENPQLRTGVDDSIVGSFIHGAPTWSSETRGGWNRGDLVRVDNLYNIGLTGFSDPSFSFSSGRLFSKTGSTSTIDQNFALMRGRHTLKIGGTYQFLVTHRIDESTPSFSYQTPEDLLASDPTSASYRFRLEPWEMTSWQIGGFVQDDIRVSPKLMLNLGLRYDYYSVPREKDDRIYNHDGPGGPFRPPDSAWDAQYNNLSPRLGLALRLDDKGRTVLRAGYGIFFSRQNLFSGPVETIKNKGEPDLPIRASFSRAELQEYGLNYPDGNDIAKEFLQASPINTDLTIDPHWKNPYSQQWTLGIQRQLSGSMMLDVAYVGSHALRLPYSPSWNRVDRETGVRPIAGFGQFSYYQSADSSTYNALQASLQKRFSGGLSFDANYTWASNMAYFRGDMHCCGGGEQPQDLDNLRENKGPTTFFIRHKFLTNWIYELPFESLVDNGNRATRLILGGWQVSGIVSAQTGQSFNVSQSSAVTARPDAISENVYIRDGGLQYLNPDAFELVPVNPVSRATIRPGNVGHRAHFLPGYWNLDFSLAKRFEVTESVSMQFRADMFNALNTTDFNDIQGSVNNSLFGRFTGTRGARVVQLNFRLLF